MMFSIFKSIILFFLKHNNFIVFCYNSRRNHAYRQIKTSEDMWSLSEDEERRFKRVQKTLQREELCSQVPRNLTQKQTPKKAKKHVFSAPDDTHMVPSHKVGRQVPRNTTLGRLVHEGRRLAPNPSLRYSHAPGAYSLRAKALFVKKARYFSQSSGGNSSYKYRIPYSVFLIQNEADQGKY